MSSAPRIGILKLKNFSDRFQSHAGTSPFSSFDSPTCDRWSTLPSDRFSSMPRIYSYFDSPLDLHRAGTFYFHLTLRAVGKRGRRKSVWRNRLAPSHRSIQANAAAGKRPGTTKPTQSGKQASFFHRFRYRGQRSMHSNPPTHSIFFFHSNLQGVGKCNGEEFFGKSHFPLNHRLVQPLHPSETSLRNDKSTRI